MQAGSAQSFYEEQIMKSKLACTYLSALLFTGAVSLCQAAEPDVKLLGDPVPTNATEKVVVVSPSTTSINVKGGEAVKFVIGDQVFAWDFDTSGQMMAFDLERIAPPGMLDHKVMVYVARDPTYTGA
jgi:hypothetical protein